MKVLHIISSGGMYGAEAVILNLSRVLNRTSHASVLGVFSNMTNPNLQLHEAAIGEGIDSNLIQCAGQIDRTVTTRIRELVAQTGADLVHAHGYKADVYVCLSLRGTRTPFVATCHNWLKGGPLVSFYGALDRFVLRNYGGVIAVSEEVKQKLIDSKVHKDKIRLIKNGIDMQPFLNAVPSLRADIDGEEVLIVGWVGRLSSEKGTDIFLEAAALVLMECPRTRFIVAGDGPDLDKLLTLLDKLKIKDSVSFVGRREDMPSVYASFDVMVSSSRQEGLPMAILEGMAAGRPLVVTAVGDVPTVVSNGETGIVVNSEDVKSLAAGIIKLLQDPSLRSRFGIAARERVQRQFSAEQMALNYLSVYEDAIMSSKM